MVGDEAGFLRILRRRASPGDVGVTGGPIGGLISFDELVGDNPLGIVTPIVPQLPPTPPPLLLPLPVAILGSVNELNEDIEILPDANTAEGVTKVDDEDEDVKVATEAKVGADD